MESLAAQLMEAFALALDLPPSWFTEKMAGHCSALRVLCVTMYMYMSVGGWVWRGASSASVPT